MTLYEFCGDKSGLLFEHFEVEGRETRFSVVQTQDANLLSSIITGVYHCTWLVFKFIYLCVCVCLFVYGQNITMQSQLA